MPVCLAAICHGEADDIHHLASQNAVIAHRHACYGAWQGYNAASSLQTPDVSEHWWRMREAALLAAGDAFSALADADEEAGGALTYMPALSIQPLLNDVLKQVITQCDVHVTQYPSWSLSCCCNSLRSLLCGSICRIAHAGSGSWWRQGQAAFLGWPCTVAWG